MLHTSHTDCRCEWFICCFPHVNHFLSTCRYLWQHLLHTHNAHKLNVIHSHLHNHGMQENDMHAFYLLWVTQPHFLISVMEVSWIGSMGCRKSVWCHAGSPTLHLRPKATEWQHHPCMSDGNREVTEACCSELDPVNQHWRHFKQLCSPAPARNNVKIRVYGLCFHCGVNVSHKNDTIQPI